jgi:hypothetical protein
MRPPRTWYPNGPMGAKGDPRMSDVGGSSAPGLPALSLNFRCLSFVFLCVINLVNMMHEYMHKHDGLQCLYACLKCMFSRMV